MVERRDNLRPRGIVGSVAGALVFASLTACSADDDGAPERGQRTLPSGAGVTAGGAAPAAGAPPAGAAGAGDTSGFANPTWSPSTDPNAVAQAVPVDDPSCAEGMANATPITPTVWLVVDGSSSMTTQFEAGQNRWQVLRSTLMDPGGVVDSLQHVARIGMVIYSGGDLLGACPNLVTVQPALDNYTTLDAQYPLDPIGTGTPTDRALDYVVTSLPVTNMDMLDADPDPVYVVLATDGQPNDPCGAGGFGNGVEPLVIDVTTRGTQAGMDMFVISLAGGDNRLQAHLEQVAQATASKTPPFVPATRGELIDTFLAIVGGATCQVSLDGTVMEGQECTGEVTLNGQPLACGSDDGWRLADPSTVQLTGTACEQFRAMQSQVRATFPCGVLVPD